VFREINVAFRIVVLQCLVYLQSIYTTSVIVAEWYYLCWFWQ